MSESDEWYYKISTGEVTRGKGASVFDRMGPYPDEATARNALEIAAARNATADERDRAEDD
ncbi:hypothetical protein L5G32_08415 [Gordonia sp. HY002]|uniref:hypothetical protein n=1 Tax=Gordonia zhenghanii TaxID=2911516 RepID=UPI001EF02164|nr:hypothetical protein [Gordonia zhenghanii]MCF8570289.1 hypothetical protein [Gordonia zhenghanii]MCF8605548.1 hypothetical protein [Gordonia zhenghanii]